MGMRHVILAVVLAVIIPVSAFGLAGKIPSPQLQFPDRATQETVSEVLNYLRNQLTFVDGSFFSESSSQNFSGSAPDVTGLIQLLQRSGFGLTVQFADLKDDRIALTIYQDVRQKETVLFINTTKKDFVLSDLKIHLPANATGAEHGAAPTAAPLRR